jgi:hypothetical protein
MKDADEAADGGEQPGGARVGAGDGRQDEDGAAAESGDELDEPAPPDQPSDVAGSLSSDRLPDVANQPRRDAGRQEEDDRQRDERDEALAAEALRSEETRRGNRDDDDVEMRDDAAEDVPRAAAKDDGRRGRPCTDGGRVSGPVTGRGLTDLVDGVSVDARPDAQRPRK